jgi:hypothetical protein
MKKHLRRYILIIIAIILVTSCNQHYKCLVSYQADSKANRPAHLNSYIEKPYFSIDSTIKSGRGCKYFTRVYIPVPDSSISWESIMIFKGKKVYMKLVDIPSKTFILFDFDLDVGEYSEIRIKFKDGEKRFQTSLLDKITTKEQIEVFIFKIKDLLYLYDDFKFIKSEDVVFFVTEQNGIIGSYVSGIEKDGQKIMIAPAGEILSDYIDYSDLELRLIQ